MTGPFTPSGAFVALFLLGLVASLATIGVLALWRPPTARWFEETDPLVGAGVYVLGPLAVLGLLLVRHPREPLEVLSMLYGNGISLAPGLEVGAWTVAWLVVVFAPPTAGVVHLAREYPGRVTRVVDAVLVYVAVVVGLFLYGLYFQTTGQPLYLGNPSWSARADDWLHALFQLPFGVAAYTLGQAALTGDRRLVAWLLVVWSSVVLQGLFLVWYTYTAVLPGGMW